MAASEFSSCYFVGVLRSLYAIYNISTLLHSLVVSSDVISGFFSSVLNLLRVLWFNLILFWFSLSYFNLMLDIRYSRLT